MKILNYAKKLFYHTSSVFTLLLLFVYTLIEILPLEDQVILNYKAILQLFAFSFLLSSVGFLLRNERISVSLRISAHFVATSVIFYVCFIVWSGFYKNLAVTLVVLTVYIILYAAFISLGLFLGFIETKSSKERKKEYKNQFSEENKK